MAKEIKHFLIAKQRVFNKISTCSFAVKIKINLLS